MSKDMPDFTGVRFIGPSFEPVEEEPVKIKKLEPVPHRTKSYITTQEDRDYQDYVSYVDQNYNNYKDRLTGWWHKTRLNSFGVVIGNDSYDDKNTKGWYE